MAIPGGVRREGVYGPESKPSDAAKAVSTGAGTQKTLSSNDKQNFATRNRRGVGDEAGPPPNTVSNASRKMLGSSAAVSAASSGNMAPEEGGKKNSVSFTLAAPFRGFGNCIKELAMPKKQVQTEKSERIPRSGPQFTFEHISNNRDKLSSSDMEGIVKKFKKDIFDKDMFSLQELQNGLKYLEGLPPDDNADIEASRQKMISHIKNERALREFEATSEPEG